MERYKYIASFSLEKNERGTSNVKFYRKILNEINGVKAQIDHSIYAHHSGLKIYSKTKTGMIKALKLLGEYERWIDTKDYDRLDEYHDI